MLVSRDMPSWAADEEGGDSGITNFLQTGANVLNEHYTKLAPAEKDVLKTAAKGWLKSLMNSGDESEVEKVDDGEH